MNCVKTRSEMKRGAPAGARFWPWPKFLSKQNHMLRIEMQNKDEENCSYLPVCNKKVDPGPKTRIHG